MSPTVEVRNAALQLAIAQNPGQLAGTVLADAKAFEAFLLKGKVSTNE